MKLDIQFKESKQSFAVNFKDSKQSFVVDFKEISKVTEQVGGTPYSGSYEVTPSVDSQRLETAKKTMLKDLVVKSIPFFEVSNTKGGTTVTIGNEV